MPMLPFRRKVPVPQDFESQLEDALDSLYRVALRLTRNSSQAEDLVHDTAVRALRFRERFEAGTNFKAWIHTILTNTFIHRYRRQKREREILNGATRDDVQRQLRSEEQLERSLRPENAYLENMLSDDVLHALDALPEDFRTVVVLCDIENLAYKEIAEAVGCPVGTVMSRLYRGRRLLEGMLAGLAVERGIARSEPQAPPAALPGIAAAGADAESAVLDITAYKRRRNG